MTPVLAGGALPLRQQRQTVRLKIRLRPTESPWHLLAQLLMCAFPAAVAVFIGVPRAGAIYLAASTALLLGYHAIGRRRYSFTCIAVGIMPILLLLRGLFFYYSAVLFLCGSVAMFLLDESRPLKELWRDRTWRFLVILGVVFWWLSVVQTGDRSSNLRVFELILGSANVVLLARRRSYLGVALLGMWISTNLLAIGMLPYGDRLGAAEMDEGRLGNPILLGVPSALLLVVSLADGGRWMLLHRRPILKYLVPLAMGQWLMLSGSRGGWLTALAGLAVLTWASRRDRKQILLLAGLLAMVIAAWITTERGAKVAEQFTKTLDSDRTLKNRTSGRSEQWLALPKAFAESPVWGWGPGTGKDVAWLYTGRHLAWHALYLQIIGETGLVGLACLLAFLGSLLMRGRRHLRRYGEVVPLACAVAYMTVGAGVSAMDATCGIYVGLALLGRDVIPRARLVQRQFVPMRGVRSHA